ncbi:MAG TPA: hypothetical protein VFX52_04140 [Nocardioidaceae bacterium]|nr:hypothetical protein [Nocardioidaceae bacterium]
MTFASSEFAPVALGFFGLGTGYLIWGPQELFGYPPRSPESDRSAGVWGLFLPGLCQLVTGVMLFVGLTWFQVFKGDPALYMAAVAFSAYGIHWFALGWNRFSGHDPRTNAGMGVAFLVLSVTGAYVFFDAGAWPVGVLFVGLSMVYVSEVLVGLTIPVGERLLGLSHLLTGTWLMYLTVGTILNIASGFSLPAG